MSNGEKLVNDAIENILEAVESGNENSLPANWEEVLVHLVTNRKNLAVMSS